MKKIILIIISGLMLSLFSLTSYAEIYRWTDKNGKVHFSDKPVSDKAKTVDINVKPSSPIPEKSRNERKQRSEDFMRAREEERAAKNKSIEEKKKLKKQRKKDCIEAKKEYKRTIEAGAVYIRDDEGDRVYLEPVERKKAEAEVKARVERLCK